MTTKTTDIGGRPSDFSEDKAAAVCSLLAEGLNLREVCAQEGMPDKATVFRWIAKHESFRDQYAKAKVAGAEVIAAEMLEIADDGSNDWMERNDPNNAGWVANGEAIARSRLRVDTRKWLLSKLMPKTYGDKVTNEHSGPDGAAIQHSIEVRFAEAGNDGS